MPLNIYMNDFDCMNDVQQYWIILPKYTNEGWSSVENPVLAFYITVEMGQEAMNY